MGLSLQKSLFNGKKWLISQNRIQFSTSLLSDVQAAATFQLSSGGFRGVQLGATAPLHDENSAWRPLFAEKCAPRRYPMTLLFKFCDQNVGQMWK